MIDQEDKDLSAGELNPLEAARGEIEIEEEKTRIFWKKCLIISGAIVAGGLYVLFAWVIVCLYGPTRAYIAAITAATATILAVSLLRAVNKPQARRQPEDITENPWFGLLQDLVEAIKARFGVGGSN